MHYEQYYGFNEYTIEEFKDYLSEIDSVLDTMLESNLADYESTRVNFNEGPESQILYCAELIEEAERNLAEGFFYRILPKFLRRRCLLSKECILSSYIRSNSSNPS